MTRPNIVLIMADQLAPHFTSTYGHPVVKTPHMDALAARGMRFDAAYCNSPLCAPSRASFMTGQLPSQIGGYDNAGDFASSIPTFAHYLRSAGYRTCLSGKMHFAGADQLHGFEERLTTDIYPADFAWVPDWENADERIDSFYHNMSSVVEAGPAATAFQLEFDEETAFFARRRLFEYAMNKVEPFCMVIGLMNPHDPYVPRPEFWDLYGDEDIDMPTSPRATDPHSERIRVGIEMDKTPGTPEQIRAARRGYYANTSYFDSKVGLIVQTLKEADQLDNTIIIITSDHGDMLGERDLWYKMSCYEHSMRVPMIIAGPGIAQGVRNSPVSLMDLAPTMMDFADADAPATPLAGRSLAPMATGGAEDGGEVLGEYLAECASHPIFMIRRGRFKYVHCDIDPPQLFDLDADPMELTNLADDPAHAAVAAGFAAEVADRWDSAQVRADVIASQHRRRAVHKAMEAGARTDWDYSPRRDASEEYVRNHVDWTVAAETTRYPPWRG